MRAMDEPDTADNDYQLALEAAALALLDTTEMRDSSHLRPTGTPRSQITVAPHRSRFAAEPHPTIIIDGEPLDIWLDSRLDGLETHLVPAQHQLENAAERALSWQRLSRLTPGASAIVPLLVCPDDLDLVCTVIVAEQQLEQNLVHWRRFGMAAGPADDPLGEIAWCEPLSVCFEREEFLAALESFRRATDGS